MQSHADEWRSADVEALLNALLQVETVQEAAAFLRDLCTLGELRDLAQRWAVVRLLDAGLHYSEISRLSGASTATITRIASWLNHGEGGYRLLLDRVGRGAGVDATAYPGAARTPYPGTGDHRVAAAEPSSDASSSVAR